MRKAMRSLFFTWFTVFIYQMVVLALPASYECHRKYNIVTTITSGMGSVLQSTPWAQPKQVSSCLYCMVSRCCADSAIYLGNSQRVILSPAFKSFLRERVANWLNVALQHVRYDWALSQSAYSTLTSVYQFHTVEAEPVLTLHHPSSHGVAKVAARIR
jgi:hypothetical protein